MGRVIFHVGPEKTGSTLIQSYFELNATRIFDRKGTQARMFGPIAVRDSGLLAQAQEVINTGEGEIPALDDLIRSETGDATVIISHESLFGHPDSAGFYGSQGGRRRLIGLFVDKARARDPGFVCYYKPPHRLLESYYRHHVMHGGQLSVMDYLAKVPLLEMSFATLWQDLVAAVGENRVAMMDARIDDAEAFFRRFCSALDLGIADGPLKIPADTNLSWSALKVEIARIANGRITPSERPSWLRAMADLRIGEESDAPLVPPLITQLVERLYADEHRELMARVNESSSKVTP